MKNYLKTASIINFLAAGFYFMMISFLGIFHISILVGIGIYYYLLSEKELEEIYSKKNSLVILSIILIPFNLISCIIGLLASDKIEKEYRFRLKEGTLAERGKTTPKPPVDPKMKKIDLLLKLGVGMVLLSGIILATSSWKYIPNVTKMILLLILSVTFFGLSIFSKEKLHLEKSEMSYWILATAFALICYLSIGTFEIFGPWFSLDGVGKHLFIGIFFGLSSLLSFMAYKRYQHIITLYLMDTSLIAAFISVLLSFQVPAGLIYLIASIFLGFVHVIPESKTMLLKALKNVAYVGSLVYPIILIMYDVRLIEVYIGIPILLISLVSLYFTLHVKENDMSQIFTPFLGVILTSVILSCYIVSLGALYVTLSVIFSSFLMILYLYSKEIGKNFSKISVFVLNITMMIILVLAMINTKHSAVVLAFPIFLLFPHVTALLQKKAEERYTIEKYFQPVKVIAILAAIFYFVYRSGIEMHMSYMVLMSAAVIFTIYCFLKDTILKKTYYVVYYVLILVLLSMCYDIYTALFTCIAVVFGYYIVSHEKEEYKKVWSYLFLLGTPYLLFVGNDQWSLDVLYRALLVFLYNMGVLFLQKEGTTNFKLAFGFLIFPLHRISITIPWDEFRLCVESLCYFWGLALICKYVAKSDRDKNILAAIGSVLILLFVIFYANIIIALYVGMMSLVLLAIGYKKPNYSSLFTVGFVMSCLNLVLQFKALWSQLPFWLYLMVAGFVLIGVVMYKEMKK